MAKRLSIRRIGNSLGVIIPRKTLRAWALGEGAHLVLTDRCIRPSQSAVGAQQALVELKRRLAAAVAARCVPRLIRAHSLANLYRWKRSGAWVSAYEEWQRILQSEDDGELFAAMLGRDERANRLRQSPPYVGLLPREEVMRLNEETPA